MSKKVIILGGGVAGMSAAHELAERGFEVEVYEQNTIAGGKARSVSVPDTEHEGRPGYPGEHGFRFFPRFYKHVTDTMKRIPFEGNAQGVFDNLVDTSRIEMARFDLPPFTMSARFPRNLDDLLLMIHDAFDDSLGVNSADREFFGERIWQILTSCQQRRDDEYEKLGWWKFIEAEKHSHAYQNVFGYGLTRSLVAAKADLASTKTVGDILVQLLFDALEPGVSSDRVLNGPTNDVWIEPWRRHLESLGVKYHLGAKVLGIHCKAKTITGATIEKDGARIEVHGDYYIAAFPVEVMAQIIDDNPELTIADPTFANIQKLSCNVAWMNGAQFYLTTDAPICNGHVIYIDSPWALTSISQHQFWPDVDLGKYGDGKVRGILSVDISEWGEPGILFKKAARDCTREEIKAEVWAQLKRSLNNDGQTILRDEDLHDWNLDSDIVFDVEHADGELACDAPQTLSAQTSSSKTKNREPLLVNLIKTWHLRPKAHTAIHNLFLASDYVQTYTDLATMEGANEAARRATNGIIDAAGLDITPCKLWQLHEPNLLAPFRAYDLMRYELGLKWKRPLSIGADPLEKIAKMEHAL
jgi:uncharacterized protein with NAD-binding domain and iron-sulfur cluster